MRHVRKIFAALLLAALSALKAEAVPPSREWREALEARTAKIWVDAQFLEEIVLNARARIDVTWLPLSLQRRLDRDRQVDEWVVNGLGYYSSTRGEVRRKMKGREVIALNYRAGKTWTFDPTQLSIGEHRVASDDLLGHPDFHVIGELPSGTEGTLFIAVPALKPGRRVRVALGPDSADLDIPKR